MSTFAPVLNPAAGVNRAVRSLVLGLSCFAVTVGGHSMAAGHVSTVGMSLVGLLMVAMAAFVTSRELTMWRLTVFLASAQFASHFMLSSLAPQILGPSAVVNAPMPSGHHSTMDVSSIPSQVAGSEELTSAMDVSWSMALAHLVACVAVALLLRQGERIYFSLHAALPEVMRVLCGLAVPRIRSPHPVTVAGAGLHTRVVFHPSIEALAREITRRGPPSLLSSL